MLNNFSCTYWPLIYLLWKNVCSEPLPISKRIMWGNFCYCMSSIYFGYCPLPDIWFANTFFPFCRLHFHSIDFYFCASFLVWYSPSCSFFILLLVFQVCFFFLIYFEIVGKLLYNVVLVSAIQQCKSVIIIHITPPSWASNVYMLIYDFCFPLSDLLHSFNRL